MVKFSVKKPYTVLVAVIIVILLGVVSFGDLKVDLLPSIDMPYSLIVTAYPGATPEEVEANVTEPIESAMATISNIKSISSSSSENYSTVTLEFEQNAKMDAATVEIRETLNQITEYWDSSIGNPIIVNINPDMIPVLAAAVSVSGVSNEEATRIIDEQVTPRIESLEGVASADITGNVTTDISVRLDQDKISEVNEKIKNKIEEKLSEAEQELADAKAALEEGQAALDQGQSVAMEQFSEAERQMAQGNNALIMGLLELNEKETEVNLALTALQVEEAALQASIAAMEAGNGSGSTNTPSLPNVNIQIPDINGSGTQTVNPSNYNPPTLEELKAQLADVQNQIAQLKAAQEQMAKARAEIDTNKTALEEAQAMASQAELQAILEMANAQAQIYVGKSAIESGEKQLEAAKEQSLAQADISSMLTADTIGAILMAQNFDMPAGYINEDKEQILVRVGDRFEDIDQISKLVIFSMEDFEDVRLKDVATVEYVDDSDRVYSKVNGETGILMLIQKQTGYSTSEVSNKVQERLETIHTENPSIGYAVLMDQGIYINLILKSVLQNILIGAALAIILLILFLRSWRPTLIIAISIPVSILAALVLMFFTGVSLNIIS
ncbi:MAG: efflux RND transporter permease subunit, partial [Parasporobacterium sp.]|nr:efflux RND transporter permease subunit [Parasporobacterium sp.]